MKKIFTLSLSIVFALSAFAQSNDLKPFSIGFNFGGQAGLTPLETNETPKIYEPTVFQLNAKGMLNETWGVMLGGNYQFINTESYDKPTNHIRLFAHGVMNAGQLMNFESFSESLGMHVHAGIGAGAIWQPGRFPDADSPLFNQADEFFTWGLGITPYMAINDQWAVNLDYSYTFHVVQTRPFDMGELQESNGIDASLMTLTVGVSYHFVFNEDNPYPLLDE